MNINLDLPPELENELSTEASQLNLPLSEYILRILSVRQVIANPPKTGAIVEIIENATIPPSVDQIWLADPQDDAESIITYHQIV